MSASVSGPRTFLTAEWRALAMLNFEVDPALLRPRVPRGTELDAWRGRTLVSVVGFLFLRTRVLGIPVPFHGRFEEVNLRFYVRRGDRRGVVFVKEIVPKRAVALVARAVYNERYVALPMRHACPSELGAGARVEYGWRLGSRWCSLAVRAEGEAALPVAGSEEEFVTEHYFGYAVQRDGGSVEYEVEHPRWRAWRASEAALDADVAALYGRELAGPLAARPSSAFVADGSEVRVRTGVRIC